MKIGIFANGEYGNKEFYINEIKELEYVIGVDGGNNFLKKINVLPNLCIGDLDSISKATLKWLKDVRKKISPKEKDQSDTYLALKEAFTMNPEFVYLYGGLGKRMDHSFSNILLLSSFDFTFKEESIEIYVVKDFKSFQCSEGETWSILPLKNIEGLTLKGFKYSANKIKMSITNPIGLSNVTVQNEVSVEIQSGIAVIFRNKI